jgi:hypothetical protein
MIDEKGRPMADQNGQPLMGVYDLTAGKYDLDVKTGPSFATQRQETLDALIEIIRANPAAAGVLGDVLVKLLDIQDADEIAERLRALLPPELRGDDPRVKALTDQLQQAQQQNAAALQDAQDQLRQASAAVADMQVRIDTEKARTGIEGEKLKVSRYEAETDRLKALKDVAAIIGPDLIMQIVQQTMNTDDIAPPAYPQAA